MDVQDKSTEVGIKLNNVLTSILIGVVAWVGVNIQTMGKDIAEIKTVQAVSGTEISHLSEKLDTHIKNKVVHTLGHTHVESR